MKENGEIINGDTQPKKVVGKVQILSGNKTHESTFDRIFGGEDDIDFSGMENKSDLFLRTLVTVFRDRIEVKRHNELNKLAGLEKDEVRDEEGNIPVQPTTVGGILDLYRNEKKKNKFRRIIRKALLNPKARLNDLIRAFEETDKVRQEINSEHQVIGKSIWGFGGGDTAILTTQGLMIFEGGTTKEEVVFGDLAADDFISHDEIESGDVQVQLEPNKIQQVSRLFKKPARKVGIKNLDIVGTIKIKRRKTGQEWNFAGVEKPKLAIKKISNSARVLSQEDENREKLTELKLNNPELFEDL